MAVTFIKDFDAIHFSRNPVPLAVQTDQADTYFLVEVYIDATKHYDGSFDLVATFDLAPDGDGLAYIDVSEIIDAKLEYDVPDYNESLAVNCLNVVRRFYCKVYEYVSGSLNSQVTSVTAHGVKGGISFEEYPTAGFFSDNYMKTEKLFMSWRDEVIVSSTQHHYLYYLNHTGAGIVQVTLKGKVYYTDGTATAEQSSVTAGVVQVGGVWAFPVGYTKMAFAVDHGKTVKYYEVWLVDNATSNEITARYKYVLDHSHHRNERHYLYVNSLGGVDALRATGTATLEYPVESEQAEKMKPYWYKAEDGARRNFSFSEEQVIKALTGYITADELDELRDFILAEKKYEIVNQHHLEISLNQKAKVEYGENDNLRALSFEYSYNFRNQVYTPVALRNITPVSAPDESSSSSASA